MSRCVGVAVSSRLCVSLRVKGACCGAGHAGSVGCVVWVAAGGKVIVAHSIKMQQLRLTTAVDLLLEANSQTPKSYGDDYEQLARRRISGGLEKARRIRQRTTNAVTAAANPGTAIPTVSPDAHRRSSDADLEGSKGSATPNGSTNEERPVPSLVNKSLSAASQFAVIRYRDFYVGSGASAAS